MTAPSQRSSRIALASVTAAMLVGVIAGYALGRHGSPPPVERSPEASKPVVQPGPTVAPPLGRPELLDAAAAAADAYAAGRAGSAANAELIGRAFEIDIPFGCYGPAPEQSSQRLRWSYDGNDEALRVSVAPEDWSKVGWLVAAAGKSVEAIEGFWLPRPWSRSDRCPPAELRMLLPPILPAPQPTVGLAQVFDADSPRVGIRAGRPYELAEKMGVEAVQGSEGFRVRMTGRIASFATGQPVACHSVGAELPPVCIIAVELERLSIINPITGARLADWTGG